MRQTSRLLFCIGVLSVGFISASSSQELKAIDAKKYPVFERGGFAIKVDANFGDWDMAKTVLLMDGKTWEPLGGSRDNDKDITARLRVLYDADNLYFAVEVDDDEYVANGANPWENDGVQLAIDATAA